MRRPVCITCSQTFKPHKNGVRILEFAQARLYRIWNCDVLICPGCEMLIAWGFGKKPLYPDDLTLEDAKSLLSGLADGTVEFEFERGHEVEDLKAAQTLEDIITLL